MNKNEKLKYLLQQIQQKREEINEMIDKIILGKDDVGQSDILDKSTELDKLIARYYIR